LNVSCPSIVMIPLARSARMNSAAEPSDASTTGPTLPWASAVRTRAPAPSPNSIAVLRS